MLKKQNNIVLILIVLVALTLRLVGITHGFPFIFHPDEPTTVRSALGIRFDANPKHFDWPHLYIYLNYFLYMVFAKIRTFALASSAGSFIVKTFPLISNDNLIFYFLTRCFSAILGALTTIPVYLAGKKLFGKNAGLLAAATIAFMPYHVWHSHYSLPDVPMVFFMSWALYFTVLILKGSELKNYLFSGLFVGLSASTKYNGGLSALMIPIAHFTGLFSKKRVDKAVRVVTVKGLFALFISAVAAVFGFVLGTPYAVLDFKTFSRTDGPQGAFWQFTNVGSVRLSEHFSKFVSELGGRIIVDTGYSVIVGCIILFAWLLSRIVRNKVEQREYYLIFLYVLAVFLIWFISGFEKNRSHYYFIAYPFLALIFGYFCEYFSFLVGGGKKFMSTLFLVLAFIPLLFFSLESSYSFVQGDTRNELYSWLVGNVKPGENVIYNDSILSDVLQSLQLNTKKGTDQISGYTSALVVLADEQNDKVFLSKNAQNLKESVYFDNTLRLGPSISVYNYLKK